MTQPETLVHPLLRWYGKHARALPWRQTRDPYAIWISEIMLQQTQVKTVIPYWERWMQRLPTVRSVAEAEVEVVLKLWEGLGYYSRARSIKKAAEQIQERHNGIFPDRFEDVLELPGIGRYTAGAVCSIAYNQPTPILDGNVIRVLTRIFAITQNTREKETQAKLWNIADQLVQHAAKIRKSNDSCSHLNQSIMELGAIICTPKNPDCNRCPVQKYCTAFQERRIEEFPNLGPRTAATNRRFVAFTLSHKDKFLVRQRPAGVVNGTLWEFPNVEITSQNVQPHDIAEALFGIVPDRLSRLTEIRHTITRFRIHLEVLHGECAAKPKKMDVNEVWMTLPELDVLAFPSAHRRIVEKLKSTSSLQLDLI